MSASVPLATTLTTTCSSDSTRGAYCSLPQRNRREPVHLPRRPSPHRPHTLSAPATRPCSNPWATSRRSRGPKSCSRAELRPPRGSSTVSEGTRPEATRRRTRSAYLAESQSVAGSVSPCWREEERHARCQGSQPSLPFLALRHALGLGPCLAGLCCQPPRHSLSREIGLTLSAQHAVVLVHVHTTAAGTDFTLLGHDRHTACMTLVTRRRGRRR